MIKFPTWKYHRSNKPKLVNNAEEEEDLGPGWYDSPADAINVQEAPEPESDPSLPLIVQEPFSYDGNDLEPGQEVVIRGKARRAELLEDGFLAPAGPPLEGSSG